MPYVDGFVIPIAKKHLPAYRRMAKTAGRIWKEHGALEYRECVAEDLTPAMGSTKNRVFGKMTRLKPGETVVFSWVVYRSRAQRDRVNALVVADPRLDRMMQKAPMPFDVKRMAYAGFRTIVDL